MTVKATTKDNADVNVDLLVTGYTDPDKWAIVEYVQRYGLSSEERHKRREKLLPGIAQTAATNAYRNYGAYELNEEFKEHLRRAEALKQRLWGHDKNK